MRTLLLIIAVAFIGCRMVDRPPMPQDVIERLPLRPAAVLPVTVIPVPADAIEISWTNDSLAADQLERATDIKGPWQTVPGATSSPVRLPASKQFEIFRLIRRPL